MEIIFPFDRFDKQNLLTWQIRQPAVFEQLKKNNIAHISDI